MSWKLITVLLLPIVVFAFIASMNFTQSRRVFSYANKTDEIESQHKFDNFVNKVRSGEWQLTEDRMIEGMRLSRNSAAADRRVLRNEAGLMQADVWGAICGILLQLVVVFYIKEKMAKQSAGGHILDSQKTK